MSFARRDLQGTVFHSSLARNVGVRNIKAVETCTLLVSIICRCHYLGRYPIRQKFSKTYMLYPKHMIVGTAILD
jgi:hypothetical protein